MTPDGRRRPFGTGLTVMRLAPTYFAFAIAKHLLPLRVLARLAWCDPRFAPSPGRTQRAVGCVVRMRSLFPIWDGDCLQKSLLLYRELSRAGADPTLVVGFRQSAGELEGHAWVVVNGDAVADAPTGDAEFLPAFRFGRGGEIADAPGIATSRSGDRPPKRFSGPGPRGAIFAAVLFSFAFVAGRAFLFGGPPAVMSYLSMFSCFGYASVGCNYFLYAARERRRSFAVRTAATTIATALMLVLLHAATPVNVAKAFLIGLGVVGAVEFLLTAVRAAGAGARREVLASFRDATIFPIGMVQVTFFLWPQIAINPVYDAYVYAFELVLGAPLEWLVVESYHRLHPITALATGAYLALPAAMSVVAANQPSSTLKTRVTLAMLATGAAGFVLYYISPAVGPAQAFTAPYPVRLPHLSIADVAPIWTPGHIPRNGMPSLHAVWIFLILFNVRKFSLRWRALFAIFAVLNLYAAVGRYEHWLLDVVVAVPFACGLQLACVGSSSPVSWKRWTGCGVCAALTLCWLFGFRHGLFLELSTWRAWLAVASTIATLGLVGSGQRTGERMPRRDIAPA